MENFLETVVKASQANVMIRKLPPASTRLDRIQACIPASHGARARKYYERTDLQTSVSHEGLSGHDAHGSRIRQAGTAVYSFLTLSAER
jgi:hypothetical protein